MIGKGLMVFAASCVFALSVSGQPNNAAEDKSSPSDKSQFDPTTNHSKASDGDSQKAPTKAEEEPFEWHTAVKRPESWLVLLAFPSLGVVVWQAILMRKHADHFKDLAEATKSAATATKDAAESAKANAAAALKQIGHAIDSERPWMAVSIDEEAFGQYKMVKFIAHNRGKSPAKITMFLFEQVSIASTNVDSGPHYGGDGRFDQVQWRLPGDAFQVGKTVPCDIKMIQSLQDAEHKRELVLLQGFVRYEDTFGETAHITNFCYEVFFERGDHIQLRWFSARGYNAMT